MIHLRLHHEPRFNESRLFPPGSDKGSRRFWKHRAIYRGRTSRLMKMTRVAACACDQKMRRLDQTARVSDVFAAKKKLTCEVCLVRLDEWAEKTGAKKPLTERRLRAMLRGER